MTAIPLHSRAHRSVRLAERADRAGRLIGRLSLRLPFLVGPVGAAGLSAAVGGIVQTFVGTGGLWAGLGLLSLFLLSADRQMDLRPRGKG